MAQKLYDEGSVQNIANAIRNKNGLSTTYTISEMAQAINDIPSGITEAPLKDVNFFDYNGVCLYSYTSSEFLALTTLPDNPTHDGLTAQGWNWSLADAKSYVQETGELNIGQTYITDDGKTRIYITLYEGRTSPYLNLAISGSVTVDWGDGTTENISGTNLTTRINTIHRYSSHGDFTITITPSTSSEFALIGYTDAYGCLNANEQSSSSPNRAYSGAIKKVEIGENCNIGDYALFQAVNMESVTIPKVSNIQTIPAYAFAYCYSLPLFLLPDGITSLGSYAFYYNYSCKIIILPNSVTSISTYAFTYSNSLQSINLPPDLSTISASVLRYAMSLPHIIFPSGVNKFNGFSLGNCYSLGYMKFHSTTPPTLATATLFTGLPTDCIIYVPSGTLSAYTSATNYPKSSTYTYREY